MPENSYIRVAAAVPKVSLADPAQNVETIIQILEEIKKDQPDMVVFPELSLTGYSCGELFQQETLYQASLKALETLRDYSAGYPALLVVGNILKHRDVLYNCALVLLSGQILGVVPKEYLPNKQEFYDKRWFASGRDFPDTHTTLLGQEVPTGSLIFSDPIHKLSLGIEICEDLWAPVPPSTFLYLKGANVVANLSASNALVGKIEYRRTLVSQQSARFNGAYIYASAGVDESTTDYLMDGHTLIGENGVLLKEGERFSRESHYILADLDPELLSAQRLRNSSFQDSAGQFSLDYIRTVNLELPEKKKQVFIEP